MKCLRQKNFNQRETCRCKAIIQTTSGRKILMDGMHQVSLNEVCGTDYVLLDVGMRQVPGIESPKVGDIITTAGGLEVKVTEETTFWRVGESPAYIERKKREARSGLVTFVIAGVCLGFGIFSSLKFLILPGGLAAFYFLMIVMSVLGEHDWTRKN